MRTAVFVLPTMPAPAVPGRGRSRRPDRAWRSLILLLVFALHMWIGWTLAHFHPDRPRTRSPPHVPSSNAEILLLLTFETPTHAEPRPVAPRAAPGAGPALDRNAPPSSPPGARTTVGAAVGQPAFRAPLDLSIASSTRPEAYRPDILKHQVLLEHRATRFDHAWLSEGTLVDGLARRSMIAATLLGAMGALIKPCTERQRMHYDRACVSDQYIEPGAGE